LYFEREGTLREAEVCTRAVKDDIKREIIAELRDRHRAGRFPETPGVIERTGRKQLAEEIARLTRMRNRFDNPEEFPGDYERILPGEPEVVRCEEQGAFPQWIRELAGDQGRGILYGIGTVLLLGVLLPSFGQKIKTIFSRTALEGLELIEKAHSVVARAREDIEDLIAEASLKELLKKP